MNTLFITNRTNKPMRAIISDNYTGNSLLTYELKPGSNEIVVKSLDDGIYYISLSDHNNDVIYKEKIVKN
ncbi:MAG: T9SS type A sorting domain-containing protein [Chitinophagales bacterium]|nr:T9SS type A sorting domain-containing protein [Chitinophagaceae bacterium]MCB9066092.1 T9SS type A sorting domain-containing protein [Chitinophagales bacterium]